MLIVPVSLCKTPTYSIPNMPEAESRVCDGCVIRAEAAKTEFWGIRVKQSEGLEGVSGGDTV